jgi:hypothetical protein
LPKNPAYARPEVTYWILEISDKWPKASCFCLLVLLGTASANLPTFDISCQEVSKKNKHLLEMGIVIYKNAKPLAISLYQFLYWRNVYKASDVITQLHMF